MAAELPTAAAWGQRTMRRDAWWVEPTLVVIVFTSFILYALFRVFENNYFSYQVPGQAGFFVSPFASPDLTAYVPAILANLPEFGQFLRYPAFLITPIPAGFRFTCYYYRKAYYRSFVGMPPGCAVKGQTGTNYRGERHFLLFQNLHRYLLYLAIIVLVLLWYDAIMAFGITKGHLYVSLVSLFFLLNVVLLSAYTLGCHSFRHLVGGKLDCYSCDLPSRLRHNVWGRVTMLNQRHMMWAWLSLFSVALTDVIVRLLVLGYIHDVKVFAL
ncbi:MAG: succinate dehydrogenase [Thermoplasmatota archaeon]